MGLDLGVRGKWSRNDVSHFVWVEGYIGKRYSTDEGNK